MPTIVALQQDDRRATVRLSLAADAEVFRGHFPERAVLPGVVQIDWAMRLANRCFGISEAVADDFQVKFSRIIEPGMELILTLELDAARQRLSFEYRANGQVMSSGRVKLEQAP